MTKLVKNADTHSPVGDERAPAPIAGADTVFDVLAQRAAGRSRAELWTTAVGGSMNATFIWWQHPSLHWLGAGFTAVAAYGIWGLADRAITARSSSMTRTSRLRLDVLIGVRALAIPVGIVSAIVAVGSFMAAALGGWNH